MLVCDSANQREAPDFIRHEALLRNVKFFACGKSEALAVASVDVRFFPPDSWRCRFAILQTNVKRHRQAALFAKVAVNGFLPDIC